MYIFLFIVLDVNKHDIYFNDKHHDNHLLLLSKFNEGPCSSCKFQKLSRIETLLNFSICALPTVIFYMPTVEIFIN